MLIYTFIALVALLACVDVPAPVTGSMETPQPAYAAAQSTLDYGQSQMKELSHQATVVGLNIAQAANSAAQATLDDNQRQMMELAYQATAVSLDMAQAAATQQFITEQTQMAWNAINTAQSQAATEIYSADIRNIIQTSQAETMLDVYAAHTAQANATLNTYSLTATPWAAIQADIVRIQNAAVRRSLWGEFVVTPLKVILSTLVVLLLVVGGVMAYLRLIPALELRLRTISRDKPRLLVDGMIVDPSPQYRWLIPMEPHQANLPQLPSGSAQVEIISPSEPSVACWIIEAEQKLHTDSRLQP